MYEEVTVLGVEYMDFVSNDTGEKICGSKVWYLRSQDHGTNTVCGVIPGYLWVPDKKVDDLKPNVRYRLYYEPTKRGVKPSYFEPTK